MILRKNIKNFTAEKQTEIVIIPSANYIAVRGKGNPDEEGGAYQKQSAFYMRWHTPSK